MSEGSTRTIRFYSPRGLPDIQVVHGMNVKDRFRRHTHDGFCIGMVEKGMRAMCCDGDSMAIPEGAVFVVNPGTVHAFGPSGGDHSYVIVSVPAAFVQSVASRLSGAWRSAPYFERLIYDGDLSSGILRFLSLVREGGSALETESALADLLSLLILRHTEVPPEVRPAGLHDGAMKRACEFMAEHYSEPLSLRQISRETSLSPFYFQRLFVENTGISPHDYLLQVRIRKARELLSHGHDIADVALHTGFFDQSHLVRFFRRITGTTPGAYMSMVRSARD